MLLNSLAQTAQEFLSVLQDSYLYLLLTGQRVALPILATAITVTLGTVLVSLSLYQLVRKWLDLANQDKKDQFSQRSRSYIIFMTKILLFLGSLYLILSVWGINFALLINKTPVTQLVQLLLKITLVVALGQLGQNFLYQLLIKRAKLGKHRGSTLFNLARTALRATVGVLILVTVLQGLGIDTAFLITGLGIFGLSVGLASQQVIRDYINCFLFVLEDAVKEGDYIAIKNLEGTVEQVNFRNIRLRTIRGEVHVIPYGWIDTVTNLTPGDKELALYEIAVSYDQDVDKIIAEVKNVFALLLQDPEQAKMINGDLQVTGLQRLGDFAVTVRFVIPTITRKKWAVAREFNRLVKQHFDKQGIAFPYPTSKVIIKN